MANCEKSPYISHTQDESCLPFQCQSISVSKTSERYYEILWGFMLIIEVIIYSSYTILVHLCEIDGKIPFSSSSMVLCIETLKIIISWLLYIPHLRQHGLKFPPLKYCCLFIIPAVLYCINNNIAVHMQVDMDPTTYQVLSNMKIATTAILYRIVMKRKLSTIQWVALGFLTIAGVLDSYGGFRLQEGKSMGEIHLSLRGFVMLCVYCSISGLAGVYTEYVLKADFMTSLHLQNILLYGFGIFLNSVTWLIETSSSQPTDDQYGFFKGFSLYTWLIIITQASNGLIMSVIMKYRTNITRLFLISSAMLVTTMMSVIIFSLKLNVFFVLAFLLVILALVLYNL